jgi:ketosteroid isomerase-like protein
MPATEDERFARLEHLFDLFVRGQNDEFLAGCTDDLVLNVRGSAGLATLVPRAQIAQWHQAERNLAGGAFDSSLCFIFVTEHEGVVVLTHRIDRDGVTYRYETLNHCTLRDGLLAAWFNLPMNAAHYARAWDLEPLSERAALRSSR